MRAITVRLFEGASGAAFFSESLTVDFHDGAFALSVGENGDLDEVALQTPAELWVSVQLAGGVQSDRVPVGEAPRAVLARDARKLGGVPAAEYLSIHDDGRLPWSLLESASQPAHVRDGYTGEDQARHL